MPCLDARRAPCCIAWPPRWSRSAEGLAHLEQACRLAEAAGANDVLYEALCNLAFAQRAEGQCQAARASAPRALGLRAGGPRPYAPGEAPQPGIADALRELGEANVYLGRWEEALRLLRPLLNLYQTLDDPWNYGAVLHNYGLYCARVGQRSEAISAMRRYNVRLYRVQYAVTGEPAALAAFEKELTRQAEGFGDPEFRATFVESTAHLRKARIAA